MLLYYVFHAVFDESNNTYLITFEGLPGAIQAPVVEPMWQRTKNDEKAIELLENILKDRMSSGRNIPLPYSLFGPGVGHPGERISPRPAVQLEVFTYLLKRQNPEGDIHAGF